MFSIRLAPIPAWRLAFWSVALLAALAAWLDRSPIVLDADDPLQPGAASQEAGRGDTLVVLSPELITASNQRGDFERSWVWVDLLRQEIGPIATLTPSEVTTETLPSFRLIVLSQSACGDPSIQARHAELAAFVERGGVLALELPAGALREAFAADGDGGWRTPSSVTAIGGVPPADADLLRRMPTVTRFMGSVRPPPDATTLVAMDGAPVVYTRPMGDGYVVVFDFNVGAQISALQQGLPGPTGEVHPRNVGDPVRTSDLAASPGMVGSPAPWADLLERYIVHVALAEREPLFAFWPWPEARRGALLSSHDSRLYQGRPLWMSVHERSLDARTVTFVAPPGGDPIEGPPAFDAEFVGHAALLWVPDPLGSDLRSSWGAFGVEPAVRPLTLAGQAERLEQAFGPDSQVLGVRIAGGRWTEHFTRPFRAMEALGLRYSVTYQPAPTMPAGFLFGTCQPFTPLDTTGLPFRLQEVPVCFVDPETEEQRLGLQEALELASTHAWTVHLLTSSDRFRNAPTMGPFDAWRDALRTAERAEMWIGGAGELVTFWRRRSEAALRVIGREVRSRRSDGEPRSLDYTVEAQTDARGLTLMIPVRFAGYTFETATRGTGQERVSGMADRIETETVTYAGREFRLLPLNPGFTTVGVRYTR